MIARTPSLLATLCLALFAVAESQDNCETLVRSQKTITCPAGYEFNKLNQNQIPQSGQEVQVCCKLQTCDTFICQFGFDSKPSPETIAGNTQDVCCDKGVVLTGGVTIAGLANTDFLPTTAAADVVKQAVCAEVNLSPWQRKCDSSCLSGPQAADNTFSYICGFRVAVPARLGSDGPSNVLTALAVGGVAGLETYALPLLKGKAEGWADYMNEPASPRARALASVVAPTGFYLKDLFLKPLPGSDSTAQTPAPGTYPIAMVTGSFSLTGFADRDAATSFANSPESAKILAQALCNVARNQSPDDCSVTITLASARRLGESRQLAGFSVVIKFVIIVRSDSRQSPEQVAVGFTTSVQSNALQIVLLGALAAANVDIAGLSLINFIAPQIERITSTVTTTTVTTTKGCGDDEAAVPCDDEDASPCDNTTETTTAPCSSLTDDDSGDDASIPSRFYLDTSVTLPFNQHAALACSGALLLFAAGGWLALARRSRADFEVPAGEDTSDLVPEVE